MKQPTTNRDRARGFTLVEVMIALAIFGVLAALAYASLRNAPRTAKLSSSALELTGEIQSAKGQAYARDTRVVVLLNAPAGKPIQYWTVLDPWMTLDDAMAATAGWTKPEDLVPPSPPAPAGSRFRVLNHGTLDPVVGFASGGYRAVVANTVDARCTALGSNTFVLASGTGGGGGYFPPPYCMVPDNTGCTFCTQAGGTTRGAIAFEADGRVRLLGGDGQETPAGAGSLTLSALDLPVSRGAAVAFTPSGLIHTFRGPK